VRTTLLVIALALILAVASIYGSGGNKWERTGDPDVTFRIERTRHGAVSYSVARVHWKHDGGLESEARLEIACFTRYPARYRVFEQSYSIDGQLQDIDRTRDIGRNITKWHQPEASDSIMSRVLERVCARQ
jgi:hypothetical protein